MYLPCFLLHFHLKSEQILYMPLLICLSTVQIPVKKKPFELLNVKKSLKIPKG